jgi:hypothetical protein
MRSKEKRWKKIPLRKVAVSAIGSFGAIIIVGVAVFLFLPDIFINGFFKNKIIKAFTKAYPAYSIRIADIHYNIWENRIGADSLTLTSIDSTFSCNIGTFSVRGIAWLQVLRHGDNAFKVLGGSMVDAGEIAFVFRKLRYGLRCGRMHISAPGSEIAAETLNFFPVVNDDKFFASSAFRKTRVRINIPQCKVTGADCRGLLQGTAYAARSIVLNDASFDVLVDMDKPFNKNSSRPLMPSEALSSISKIIRVNSVSIIKARLKYSERYIIGSPPAEVTFDSMRMSAEGITNHAAPGATAVISGRGVFMKTSVMKVHMNIPLASPEIPMRYSGSLDGMDLTRLNSFLEIGEGLRIKSGVLESGTFDITSIAGRAQGTLRAMYKDLNIAVLNVLTGSEKGALNRIASFMTNAMKIRASNMPDKSGSIKIGEVKYEKKRDDTFFQLIWFSLRSGIGDVIGF